MFADRKQQSIMFLIKPVDGADIQSFKDGKRGPTCGCGWLTVTVLHTQDDLFILNGYHAGVMQNIIKFNMCFSPKPLHVDWKDPTDLNAVGEFFLRSRSARQSLSKFRLQQKQKQIMQILAIIQNIQSFNEKIIYFTNDLLCAIKISSKKPIQWWSVIWWCAVLLQARMQWAIIGCSALHHFEVRHPLISEAKNISFRKNKRIQI